MQGDRHAVVDHVAAQVPVDPAVHPDGEPRILPVAQVPEVLRAALRPPGGTAAGRPADASRGEHERHAPVDEADPLRRCQHTLDIRKRSVASLFGQDDPVTDGADRAGALPVPDINGAVGQDLSGEASLLLHLLRQHEFLQGPRHDAAVSPPLRLQDHLPDPFALAGAIDVGQGGVNGGRRFGDGRLRKHLLQDQHVRPGRRGCAHLRLGEDLDGQKLSRFCRLASRGCVFSAGLLPFRDVGFGGCGLLSLLFLPEDLLAAGSFLAPAVGLLLPVGVEDLLPQVLEGAAPQLLQAADRHEGVHTEVDLHVRNGEIRVASAPEPPPDVRFFQRPLLGGLHDVPGGGGTRLRSAVVHGPYIEGRLAARLQHRRHADPAAVSVFRRGAGHPGRPLRQVALPDLLQKLLIGSRIARRVHGHEGRRRPAAAAAGAVIIALAPRAADVEGPEPLQVLRIDAPLLRAAPLRQFLVEVDIFPIQCRHPGGVLRPLHAPFDLEGVDAGLQELRQHGKRAHVLHGQGVLFGRFAVGRG